MERWGHKLLAFPPLKLLIFLLVEEKMLLIAVCVILLCALFSLFAFFIKLGLKIVFLVMKLVLGALVFLFLGKMVLIFLALL